jgi:hypothetical protein
MFYVLKGWSRLVYEGEGEHTFHEGDRCLQLAGIMPNGLEVLEIYSPAVHETVAVEKMAEAVDQPYHN